MSVDFIYITKGMSSTRNTERVLVIGDTHHPFEHSNYLNHCKAVAKFYKTTHTIHIGDGIDNHYASFHDTSTESYGAGEELQRAIDHLAPWHKAFPNTDYILGNHCRIIERKLNAGGINKKWMRNFVDVLGLDTWRIHDEVIYDNVLYQHGEGLTARKEIGHNGMSVVQGHRHTEGYVWYQRMKNKQYFGMQVGTGIDEKAYAFAYAKHHPKPILSCGVVLNHGKSAHLIPLI